MKIPLAVCHKYGQFAFQDEEKGVGTIAAIQNFIEADQNGHIFGNESQAKTVTIERIPAGVITVAKSVKLLPNIQINLKKLIQDTLRRLQETINFSTIVIGGPLMTDSWLINIGTALYLVKFAADLTTVDLKQEQVWVLIALHHLCRGGELQLEIPLSELQTKMRDNYHCSLSVDDLDDILEDLVDLHCVSRQQDVKRDVIWLTEKVVLKDY